MTSEVFKNVLSHKSSPLQLMADKLVKEIRAEILGLQIPLGTSINNVSNQDGGGVKNWSKLPTDGTKKLPIWERGVSKIGQKKFRRRLWMVPILPYMKCRIVLQLMIALMIPYWQIEGLSLVDYYYQASCVEPEKEFIELEMILHIKFSF